MMDSKLCPLCGGLKEIPTNRYDEQDGYLQEGFETCPECMGVGLTPNSKTIQRQMKLSQMEQQMNHDIEKCIAELVAKLESGKI